MLHHMWPPQLHQSSQTLPPLTVVLFASPTTALPSMLSLIRITCENSTEEAKK